MKGSDTSHKMWMVVGGIVLAAFMYFVYPTPYQMYGKYPDIARVNRFTGSQDKLTATGWRSSVEIEKEAKKKADELRARVLKKLAEYEARSEVR